MIKLLETYPEAAKLVTSYYLEKMLLSLDDSSLPEDFKDHVRAQGIDIDKIAVLAESSPRTLFDVFDENDLFIEIKINKQGFTYYIFPRDFDLDFNSLDEIFDDRKEAELKAISEAFKLLNEKLCETKS
jgi:hypothetical protein